MLGGSMSPIVLLSFVIRAAALLWSLVVWRRVRDWRIVFITILIAMLLTAMVGVLV